jgi:hypothetical protein
MVHGQAPENQWHYGGNTVVFCLGGGISVVF